MTCHASLGQVTSSVTRLIFSDNVNKVSSTVSTYIIYADERLVAIIFIYCFAVALDLWSADPLSRVRKNYLGVR